MNDKNKFAYFILKYLSKQPFAKDTLQGITQWWILKEQVNDSVEKISEALNYLIASDFIEVVQYDHQKNMYMINPEKLDEIESLLNEINSELVKQDTIRN